MALIVHHSEECNLHAEVENKDEIIPKYATDPQFDSGVQQ